MLTSLNKDIDEKIKLDLTMRLEELTGRDKENDLNESH
jgi:hypothetical protein